MTLLAFMNLFDEFRAPSWDGWRAILARLTPNVREFFGIIGRGAGKSRIVALLACFYASRAYKRAPGEFIFIGVFAPDRKQAGLTFRYIVGLLHSVPSLDALIVSEAKDSVELSNGVIIEVITANAAAPRGRAYVLVIVEEAARLPTDASANPDIELLRAVRPALARVPGSLLAVVSSPYARRGVLWTAWQKYHEKPDSDVVLVQAPTTALNPLFDQRAIDDEYEDDPANASAEYGAQFRSDALRVTHAVAHVVVAADGRRRLHDLWHEVGVYAALAEEAGRVGRHVVLIGVGAVRGPVFSERAHHGVERHFEGHAVVVGNVAVHRLRHCFARWPVHRGWQYRLQANRTVRLRPAQFHQRGAIDVNELLSDDWRGGCVEGVSVRLARAAEHEAGPWQKARREPNARRPVQIHVQEVTMGRDFDAELHAHLHALAIVGGLIALRLPAVFARSLPVVLGVGEARPKHEGKSTLDISRQPCLFFVVVDISGFLVWL